MKVFAVPKQVGHCQQWRIQDCPEGVPTRGDTNLLFGQFSPKLHENKDILGGEGRKGSATGTSNTVNSKFHLIKFSLLHTLLAFNAKMNC